jgi:hypothetical protein
MATKPRPPRKSKRLDFGPLHTVPEPASVPPPVIVKTKAPTATKQREIVIPAGVKVTRCPAPPSRYSTTGPVVGGFATMPLGQYLGETGFSKYLEGNQ